MRKDTPPDAWRRVLLLACAIGPPAAAFGCSDATNGSSGSDGGPATDATLAHDDAGAGGERDAGSSNGDGDGDGAAAEVESGGPQFPADAASDGAEAGGFPDPSTFACNSFIGVSVTGDWFVAGFEQGLAGDHWQAKTQSLAFVEKWADPNDAVWAQALTSACASGSDDPDRVIFTGVNWTFTGEADWEAQLTAVVGTLEAKYPGLREIDLMTMLRAPGNMVCGTPGSPEQVVQPFIDQAIAAVVAKFPTLVRAAPAFYAPSCAVFQPNSPHFADGGAAAVAKVMSDYYVSH